MRNQLDKLFQNNFDCYSQAENGEMNFSVPAMTKNKFVEIVSKLLTEENQATSFTEKRKSLIADISKIDHEIRKDWSE